MIGLLVFGSIWFWIFVAIVAIAIISCLEAASSSSDSGGGLGATIVICSAIGIYIWLGDKYEVSSVLNYLKTNALTFVYCFFGYYVAGILWSFIKWYFFLHFYKLKLQERIREEGEDFLKYHSFPSISQKKYKIISWMSYWPFSLIWTLAHDFVKKIYNYLYSKLTKLYTIMEERALGDLKTKGEVLRSKSRE